jgi:hypothetical protein
MAPDSNTLDDSGNLVVQAELEEFRLLLLAFGDVHREHLVRQPHLFQRDGDLAAVRRIPRMQFDGHAFPFPIFATCIIVRRGRKRRLLTGPPALWPIRPGAGKLPRFT